MTDNIPGLQAWGLPSPQASKECRLPAAPTTSKLGGNCGHGAQPARHWGKTRWGLARAPDPPATVHPESRQVMSPCSQLRGPRAKHPTAARSPSAPPWDVPASWMPGRMISNSQLSPLPFLSGGQQSTSIFVFTDVWRNRASPHLHILPALQQAREFHPKPGSFKKGDASPQLEPFVQWTAPRVASSSPSGVFYPWDKGRQVSARTDSGTGGTVLRPRRALPTCAPSPGLAAPLPSLPPRRWRKSVPRGPGRPTRRPRPRPRPRLPPRARRPRRCWAARATGRAPPPPRRAGPRPPSPTPTPGRGTRAVGAAPWPTPRRTVRPLTRK